jgi:hypothetical protein
MQAAVRLAAEDIVVFDPIPAMPVAGAKAIVNKPTKTMRIII